MTGPAGGLLSTQDAISEGEEGKFFIWTPDEIRGVLDCDADELMAAYGFTPASNLEAKNILEFVGAMDQRPVLAGSSRVSRLIVYRSSHQWQPPGQRSVTPQLAPTSGGTPRD
jgi:uncharacterized protein YyaL (SSP411 family)